jgi:hypothetical protein
MSWRLAERLNRRPSNKSDKHCEIDRMGNFLAYFCRNTGVTVLSAVGMAPAATSGPKRRHCNVHNGLTRSTRRPTATLAVCLHPRPGWSNSHPRLRNRTKVSLPDRSGVRWLR